MCNTIRRLSWKTATLVLALIPAVATHAADTRGVFYVAANGDDKASGSRAEPFATIERAVQATRDWRKLDTSTAQLSPVIYIGPGVYILTQPLVLQPEDSNLTLAGLTKDRPVLSGGRRISGWKQVERQGKRLWAADLPDVRNGNWFFRELWVNGRRALRARHPNKGYLKVAGLPDARPDWTRGQTRFRYTPGDLQPWSTITEAEVVVMNRWAESRLPIVSVQEDQSLINFGKRTVFALEEGDLYYVEGAFEALDEPGEWYLDRRAGTLYYLERAGESLRKLEVFAPNLSQVLRLEGQPDKGRFIEGITVTNLDFSHTEWCFPEGFARAKDKPTISPEPEPEVGGFGQAEVGVPGAVWGQGVRSSSFVDCAFKNLGNYGLELARGCQSNRIIRCELSELGAGGIKIGETAIRSEDSDQTRANEITDCRIHDGGKMFHSAIGVWIGQSADNRILHNVIHDFYYTGISIGWTWGYGPALASNNVVAFNEVHHIGVKSDGDGPILSDMGGIYTLGKQPGTRIENNLWHNIAGFRYGGWGIYFDEGSSGIVAVSNVVYRTTHGGFHQHYGETNIVRNNIFAFGRDQQLQRTRVEPHMSFMFETNLVYFDSGSLLAGNWSQDKYQMDWNLYFDARPGAKPADLRFEKATLEQWRERGHDKHSVIAGPLFKAPDLYDFHLRSGSPAFQIGFHPIDLSRVGPLKLNYY
jgi:hypothetical protein